MNTTAGPILRCRHEDSIARRQFHLCVALEETRLGNDGMPAFWPKVDVQADKTGDLTRSRCRLCLEISPGTMIKPGHATVRHHDGAASSDMRGFYGGFDAFEGDSHDNCGHRPANRYRGSA